MSLCTKLVILEPELLLSQKILICSHCIQLVTLHLESLTSPTPSSVHFCWSLFTFAGHPCDTAPRTTHLPNTLICSLLLAVSHCTQLMTLHIELLTSPTSFPVHFCWSLFTFAGRPCDTAPRTTHLPSVLTCSLLLVTLVRLHLELVTSSSYLPVHFCCPHHAHTTHNY